MFERRFKRLFSQPAKDFRDGRAWQPLDLEDGRPRIMLTVDVFDKAEDGSSPVHVDFWNGISWTSLPEVLMIAQRIASAQVEAQMRGQGEPITRTQSPESQGANRALARRRIARDT